MRVDDAFLARLDDFRRSEPDLPSRAVAIRRLVDIGLNIVAKKHRPGRK
jgi:hypothetical protein